MQAIDALALCDVDGRMFLEMDEEDLAESDELGLDVRTIRVGGFGKWGGAGYLTALCISHTFNRITQLFDPRECLLTNAFIAAFTCPSASLYISQRIRIVVFGGSAI